MAALRDLNASPAGQLPVRLDSLWADLSREAPLRLRFAVCFVLAAVAQAHGQQTVTVPPPPPPLPSTFPQFQTYAGCLMNCDTKAGTCQSSCSVNNSPAVTFAGPTSATVGTRPDAGALAACYQSCSTQTLVCKQACTPPQ
jgi:hypothetical protein